MDIGASLSKAPAPDPVPTPGRRRGAAPVKWLSPGQLVTTGLEVAQASLFARFADKRDVEAVTPRQVYDLSAEADGDEPFVVDYVADTGDGFDPSFAVAASVAHGAWGTGGPGGDPGHPTRLLLLGGDEVYPVASIEAYHDRLVHPYAQAYVETSGDRPQDPPWPTPDGRRARAPYVLAIPGNHDWYDSLAAFRRVFCETWVRSQDPAGSPSAGRMVAPDADRADVVVPAALTAADRFAYGWTCLQSRSYWAARLPHGWWVWGIDIQLDAAIDAAQLAYFREAALLLGDDDRLVVCTARPSWVDRTDPAAPDVHRTSNKQTLVRFLDRVLGPEGNRHRVRMLLSGDRHHYVRHTIADDAAARPADGAADGADRAGGAAGGAASDLARPEHLVTCGSGGAYLSSTHHEEPRLEVPFDIHDTTGGTAYVLRAAFPDQATSRDLCDGWLRAAFGNTPGLPALFAGVYAFVALAFARTTGDWVTWVRTLLLCLAAVGGLAWYGASASGRGSRSVRFGAAVGGVHGVVHLVAAFGLLRLLAALWRPDVAGPGRWLAWVLRGVGTPLALVLAGVVGAVVLAAYLRVADGLGMHENDSFSALGITDYKAHLRLSFLPDRIEVRALGLDRVTTHEPAAGIARRFDVVDAFDVARDPVRVVDVRAADAGSADVASADGASADVRPGPAG